MLSKNAYKILFNRSILSSKYMYNGVENESKKDVCVEIPVKQAGRVKKLFKI